MLRFGKKTEVSLSSVSRLDVCMPARTLAGTSPYKTASNTPERGDTQLHNWEAAFPVDTSSPGSRQSRQRTVFQTMETAIQRGYETLQQVRFHFSVCMDSAVNHTFHFAIQNVCTSTPAQVEIMPAKVLYR